MGEEGRDPAIQRRADGGMQTIGAQQQIGLDHRPRRDRQARRVIAQRHLGRALQQQDLHPRLPRGRGQQPDQIGAMQEAILLLRPQTRHIEAQHPAPRAAIAQLDGCGARAGLRQRFAEAERAQHRGTIRADLQPGPDLADLGGLLQHRDRGAALRQRRCHGEARDPGAQNGDPLADQHSRIRPCHSLSCKTPGHQPRRIQSGPRPRGPSCPAYSSR